MDTNAPQAITPDLVRSLWDFMKRRCHSRVLRKRNRLLMKVVAWFVAIGSPMDRLSFLEDYATTIFRRIYVPFDPGITAPKWSLRDQYMLAVHEHQHVLQSRRDGRLRFAWRYLRDTRARALYEAEALLTEYHCAVVLGVPMRSPADRAGALRSYGVTKADVSAARDYLEERLDLHGDVYHPTYLPEAALLLNSFLELPDTQTEKL